MQLSADDLRTLAQCATAAAVEAGQLIASRAGAPHEIKYKSGDVSIAARLVTEVDLLSEAVILKHLQPTFEQFDLALLTEESADDHSRLERDYFWCIDPLDGTLPFIESVPGYSVSIGLVSRSGEPLIGVVYDPITKILYSAVKGRGVMRNGEPWQPPRSARLALTLVCDRSLVQRSDYPQLLAAVEVAAQRLGLSGVETLHNGGAVVNACWVLEHAPACYFKLPKPNEGGGSLWDFAATAAIFSELGATATDFYGQSLELNRSDSTFMNHRGALFASSEEIAVAIRGLPELSDQVDSE